MKKTLLTAAVLVLAACSKKAETPAADTTAATTPAPAMPADTGMAPAPVPGDTTMMHPDSTMARDSMHK